MDSKAFTPYVRIVGPVVMLTAGLCLFASAQDAGSTGSHSPSATSAKTADAQAADLRQRMEGLAPGSPERAALAVELLEMKHTDAPPPTTKTGKSASLPAWAVEQIKRLRLQPLTLAVAQRERDVAAVKDSIARRIGAAKRGETTGHSTIDSYYSDQLKTAEQRLADARKHLQDTDAGMPALIEHIAAEYPNGVVRCPACHGTGEVTGDVTYVPSVTTESGRTIGGGTVTEHHKCSACDGLGLAGRDADYDRAVAAVTPAQITQKRAAMEQRWESYLKNIAGKGTLHDPMPVFAGEDAIFINELDGSPSAQAQKVRTKLASVKQLTDTQVAEMIVEDGSFVDKAIAKVKPTDLFGGHRTKQE